MAPWAPIKLRGSGHALHKEQQEGQSKKKKMPREEIQWLAVDTVDISVAVLLWLKRFLFYSRTQTFSFFLPWMAGWAGGK